MTKLETIAKIEEACTRVLKQADFVGGATTAITLVIQKLTEVRDRLAAGGDTMDANTSSMLYSELYECGRIIGTIYDGYPMVPAEDVATLAAADDMVGKSAGEIPGLCIELLEKAAEQKGLEAGLGVALVRCIVDAWKATGEQDAEDAKLLVPRAEALIKLAKACGDKKREAQVEAAKAEQEQTASAEADKAVPESAAGEIDETSTKLDSIAKAAEQPAPEQPSAPAPVVWPVDLNARR